MICLFLAKKIVTMTSSSCTHKTRNVASCNNLGRVPCTGLRCAFDFFSVQTLNEPKHNKITEVNYMGVKFHFLGKFSNLFVQQAGQIGLTTEHDDAVADTLPQLIVRIVCQFLKQELIGSLGFSCTKGVSEGNQSTNVIFVRDSRLRFEAVFGYEEDPIIIKNVHFATEKRKIDAAKHAVVLNTTCSDWRGF